MLLVIVGIGLRQLIERGPGWLGEAAHSLGAGEALRHSVELAFEELGHTLNLDISPDIILFVFVPTLIYESALHLDVRQLRRNLVPVLTLAVPGLLLSTGIIGTIIWLVSPFDLASSLLLGSILSATDPVAVIALFRQLGAPARLTVLVEGESLFNDATAIVVARILVGVAALGHFSGGAALQGFGQFLIVFLGGALAGWIMALAIGWILGKIEDDAFIQTALTTILAYLSFIIAEELLHVSGVMATVAAGLTMGGWGATKIAAQVESYLAHFWDFAASVANALLFLMVGLNVRLGQVYEALDLLVWVILAMLISRAVVIFGLVPLVGRLPGSEPVGVSYRAVMYWGGLRGAIAIAIVLSLEDFVHAEAFLTLVMGAVLFTLLVQGLTIQRLVHMLGLDRIPLADRVGRDEGLLSAMRGAQRRIPELQRGGLFSEPIAADMQRQLEDDIRRVNEDLENLRRTELDATEERRLLMVRCFAGETAMYHDMFSKGHLSERAYRDLRHSVVVQSDSARHDGPLPPYTLHPRGRRFRVQRRRLVDALFGFTGLPEAARRSRISVDYETAWGRHQASGHILANIQDLALAESTPPEIVTSVRDLYSGWNIAARTHIDNTAQEFPEFVTMMQGRLAARLVAQAETEIVESEVRAGAIPSGIAQSIIEDLTHKMRAARGGGVKPLHVALMSCWARCRSSAASPRMILPASSRS